MNLALSLVLKLFLFSLWVLVGILHSQLGDEDLDVEIIADFLAIEQKLLHLEAALTELLLQVELLILILAHANVTESLIAISLLFLLPFLLFLRGNGRFHFFGGVLFFLSFVLVATFGGSSSLAALFVVRCGLLLFLLFLLLLFDFLNLDLLGLGSLDLVWVGN